MQQSYAKALGLVLVHEGGYSNHPQDPGGATMKGVIQRVYDAYRQRKGQPTRSVKHLAEDELQEIYRQLYWNKIDGDQLPAGVDYCVFDGAVNSGPYQSAKWLQRGLNDVLGKKVLAVDGNIGPATLAAAEDTAIRSSQLWAVIDAMCDRRLAMLKGLKTWPTFGKGWATRVSEVRAKAKGF
jgi:lysozyme family protein